MCNPRPTYNYCPQPVYFPPSTPVILPSGPCVGHGMIVPGSERTVHSYSSAFGQTELNTQNSHIRPWSLPSDIQVRPEVATLLTQIQTGAFQGTPEDFATLTSRLGELRTLNRAEFYAAATMLMAAIEQRPSEFADPARRALCSLLQNNPNHVADQVLIASQIVRHLDASHTANADIRQAALNILSGRSADGTTNLNFQSISTSGQFTTAAEGLRDAMHTVPEEAREGIRLCMARLFEQTHTHANRNWRDFRIQCAEVVEDRSNAVLFLSGDSPGAIRLQAALQALRTPAVPPLLVGSGGSTGGTGNGGGIGGNGQNSTGGGAMLTPPMLTPEQQIEMIIANPSLARQLISNPNGGLNHTAGGQTLFIRIPGVPTIEPPPGAVVRDLTPQQMGQLITSLGRQPAPGAPNAQLTPDQFANIREQLRSLPAIQQHPDAVVQAAINLSQNQVGVSQFERQYLLLHLLGSPTIQARPDLVQRLNLASNNVPK